MKKVVFILLLLFSIRVNAAVSISCPGEAKLGTKIECKVNATEDITTTSFKVSGDFTSSITPIWSRVESGGVNTFNKESSTSLTIATIDVTFQKEGSSKVTLTDIPNQGSVSSGNINVTNTKSDNANLASLTVNGKSVTGFSKDKTEYKVKVTTNKVNIEAKSENDKAQVNVPGEQNLSLGDQTFNITVTSESGKEKIYKLVITYEAPKDTDNSLKTLELYNGNTKIKELEYHNGVLTYEGIKVKTDVSKLTIKATLNNSKAQFVKDYGPRDAELDYGENILEVRVEAESGEVATYTIKVNREDGRSTDATLSKLIVNDVEVELKDKVYEYEVKVRYNETKSHIDATPTNKASKVDYKDIDLVSGLNESIKLTVTSENNKTQDYIIKIFRLSEAESKITLQKVEVVNYDIDFSKYTEEYSIKLRPGDEKLKFVVLPSEGIKVNELNNENLKNKSTVILRVTDDEKTWTYKFNIITDEKESNNTLLFIILIVLLLGIGGAILYFVLKKKKIKEEKNDAQEQNLGKTELIADTQVFTQAVEQEPDNKELLGEVELVKKGKEEVKEEKTEVPTEPEVKEEVVSEPVMKLKVVPKQKENIENKEEVK